MLPYGFDRLQHNLFLYFSLWRSAKSWNVNKCMIEWCYGCFLPTEKNTKLNLLLIFVGHAKTSTNQNGLRLDTLMALNVSILEKLRAPNFQISVEMISNIKLIGTNISVYSMVIFDIIQFIFKTIQNFLFSLQISSIKLSIIC